MRRNRSGLYRRSTALAVIAAMSAGSAIPAAAQDASSEGETRARTSSSEPVVLSPITVTGATYQTEGTGSYASDMVSIGGKEARPMDDVPQSTTVVTRAYMDDRKATTLDTAMRETPGIVVLDNDNGRSSIFSRGFEIDRLNYNGLSAPVSSKHGTLPDMAIVDHVEILKGPAGLFEGTGNAGGTINMSLKRPRDEFAAETTVRGDSWGGARAVGDISAPLTENGALRGRLIAVRDQSRTWVDNNDNDETVGYGTLQADVTERSTLTLSLSHLKRDLVPFNGLPAGSNGALLDLDRSTTTSADWSNFESNITDVMTEFEHRFDGGGLLKVSSLYSERASDAAYSWAGSAAAPNGNIGRVTAYGLDFEETSLTADAHVSQPVRLFGHEHNVLLGADFQQYGSTELEGRTFTGDTNNIFNWSTNLNRPTIPFTTQTDVETDRYGVYGQLRVKPADGLTLIGGLRGTWYESETTNLLTGTTADQSIEGETTPYAGVVYDVTDAASVYASYTEIFQPQTETDPGGNLVGSRTGTQYETGVKGSLLDDMNASAALFYMTEENRAVDADGNRGGPSVGADIRVRGLELETSGSPLPGLEVMAGYSYTIVDYTDGPNTALNSVVRRSQTPKHQLQFWAKQQIPALEGLYAGGGVKAYSGVNNGTLLRGGYVVADAMVGYDINETFSASLNVNNLFDTDYYARVGNTMLFNFYGEPRSAVLELSATF